MPFIRPRNIAPDMAADGRAAHAAKRPREPAKNARGAVWPICAHDIAPRGKCAKNGLKTGDSGRREKRRRGMAAKTGAATGAKAARALSGVLNGLQTHEGRGDILLYPRKQNATAGEKSHHKQNKTFFNFSQFFCGKRFTNRKKSSIIYTPRGAPPRMH